MPQDTAAMQPLDLSLQHQEMAQRLTGSKEIDELVSQISVYDTRSIVTFGSGAAQELSQCSDAILKGLNTCQPGDSSALLSSLGHMMEQFDPAEISGEKKGLLARLRGDSSSQLDRLLAKYQAMGRDMDRVYIELKRYEADIAAANQRLQTLLDANLSYYRSLVKYVLAGEQGLKELEAYLSQLQRDLARRPGDGALQLDVEGVQQAYLSLQRRVHDLRLSETVAMQSIPMLRTMQISNQTLMDKIRSSFLVTIPIFKQSLSYAVSLKRQRLQNQAMADVDRRVRERLGQAEVRVTRQESSEALEQTWRTITSGIQETRQLQQEADAARIRDTRKLEELRLSTQGA